jgi:uncharacterized protein
MQVAAHTNERSTFFSRFRRVASSKRNTSRIPTPRTPKVAFDEVPKHWFVESAAATHVANAVNLLFPAGERFFVRSVRHYMDRVSPELAAQVKGFFGQEGRHAQAHERFFDTLRAQGYDVDSILERYEYAAYEKIEKYSPPAVRLAVTVALEHFTAIMAEDALGHDALAHADPEMRRLFEWHAVEELEHKAVAFDVLQEVAPGYALRMLGVLLATLTLGGFWVWALRELLKEEGMTLSDAMRELRDLRKKAKATGEARVMEPVATRVFVRGIREYMRPGFHPNDKDHGPLIRTTLERLRSEGVVTFATEEASHG